MQNLPAGREGAATRAAPAYCFFVVSEDELPGVELLLGEELLGDALELEPLEDDLSLEELGEDDDPEAEPEELGVLLLGELDIEPEPEDEPEDDGEEDEPDPDDSGLLDLEPEAPVLELEPRSQP